MKMPTAKTQWHQKNKNVHIFLLQLPRTSSLWGLSYYRPISFQLHPYLKDPLSTKVHQLKSKHLLHSSKKIYIYCVYIYKTVHTFILQYVQRKLNLR